MAVQARELHRALPCGRHDGHSGAADWPKTGAGAGHHHRGGQQRRCRRQRGLRDRIARPCGWLHPAGRHHQLARHQCKPLPQAGLRPGQIVFTGRTDRLQSCRAGGRPEQSLQDLAGRAGRRQGKAQNPLVRIGRQRHLAASGAGTAGFQIRHAVHPCALQGQRPGHSGCDWRPGRHDVRHHRGGRPAHPERQSARARRHLGQTAGIIAPCAHGGRIGPARF